MVVQLDVRVDERDDLVGLLGWRSCNEGMSDGVVLSDFLSCFEGDQNTAVGVAFPEIVDQNIRNNLRRPTNLGLGGLGCLDSLLGRRDLGGWRLDSWIRGGHFL